MHTVVADTNSLLMPFQWRINIDAELSRLLGAYRVVVPDVVLSELRGMKAKEARSALALAERYDIVRAEGRGDEAILSLAKKLGAYLLTNDKELRKKAGAEGVRVIYLKARSHLVIG